MGSTFTPLAVRGSAQLTDTEQRFLLVGAEHLVKTHDGFAVEDTQKSIEGFTEQVIETAASLTIWTVVAAERFLLQSIVISSDINTLFQLLDGTTIFLTARMSGHDPLIYNYPNDGYESLADGNDLIIKSQGGSGTKYSVWAVGHRVTAAGLFLR